MQKEWGENNIKISRSIYNPRSQAIYGSSVETFGPYPQDYTTNICLLLNSPL
jgi:hypothetical protein